MSCAKKWNLLNIMLSVLGNIYTAPRVASILLVFVKTITVEVNCTITGNASPSFSCASLLNGINYSLNKSKTNRVKMSWMRS